MKYEIEISKGLYDILNDYTYEMETDTNTFVINAIIEKINRENEIFTGDVNADGWANGKSSTENFLNI